jgi:uncharacterized protein (DUF2141 family)
MRFPPLPRSLISLPVLLVLVTAMTAPALAARIIVKIDGVHSNRGNVFVGLYSNPRDFLNGTHCDVFYKVKASTAPITVAFDNLRPGTYAVGAYHDENGNNHLDTSILGLPIEGYALSNDVRAIFAKPQFYQAAFTVGSGDKPVALHIRY